MCGRFTLYSKEEKITKQFSLAGEQMKDFVPSYNIAPSQSIYVIYEAFPDRETSIRKIARMQWGLIPFWNKEEAPTGIINARLETVEKKPAFKQVIKHHRCLVVADGFYEWKPKPSYKQPYYICTKDQSLFAMAGIWSHWKNQGKTIDSCAILTIEANKVLAPIHARMPALLSAENYDKWLDPNYQDLEVLKALAKAYPIENLVVFPVDRKVNNFKYNHLDCIKPAPEVA